MDLQYKTQLQWYISHNTGDHESQTIVQFTSF